MKTEKLEWAVYLERLRQHEFDACSLLWTMQPRNDPYQIWHSSSADGGSNFIQYNNPEVDALLEKARGEFDDATALPMYHRFSEILAQQQPYTLLFNRYNLSVASKKLGGLRSTPFDIFRLEELYFSPP